MRRSSFASAGISLCRFLAGLPLLLGVLLVGPGAVRPAAAQETIAYQGYLTNTDGDPANGTATIVFNLYNQRSGGTALWRETQQQVLFTDGVFSVHLGSVESLAEVPFDGPLWLGVSVAGSQELTPRTALGVMPYALSVRGLAVTPAVDEDYGIVPNLAGGYAGNRIGDGDVVGATISGGGGEGVENIISHSFGTVGGGHSNRAGATGATVGGGRRNEALGCYDTVAGGDGNRAQTDAFGAASKGAGMSCGATVGGGRDNVASADGAMVGGGVGNTASGYSATVGGGRNNTASGTHATVPGGEDNQARGDNSLAAGTNARAAHDGTFVWSDEASSDSLVSTADNQFLIRASGGVGIGTNSPSSPLTVAGRIESTTGGFRFPDGTVQTTAAPEDAAGWRLGGNSGLDPATDFMGTRDNTPLEVRVNNARALSLEPGFYDSGSKAAPNIIFGITSNIIAEDLRAVTISGGGDIFNPNEVTANYGTIGGGWGNTIAGNGATVGGGGNNDAIGAQATIGGGSANEASGEYATVAGGLFNKANGDYSMAAGARAGALHEGTFVWADNSSVNAFNSSGANQYVIRAVGGVGIGTNSPAADLHLFADSGPRPHLLLEEDNATDYARLRMKNTSSAEFWDLAAGTADTEQLNFFASNGRGNVMTLHATGDPLVMHNGAKLTEGGTWTNASSRLLKTDFEAVDGQAVLARLAQLPVETWRYKAEASARHMGPTAEAFAAAFGLGDTDRAIATVDADGVALAAIQGLHAVLQQQQAQIDALRAEVEALRALVRQPSTTPSGRR